MRIASALAVCAATAVSATASVSQFTNEADFLAQLDGAFLYEDFSGLAFGVAPNGTAFSDNGFTATASAVDSATDGDGAVSELFNDVGVLSVENATDALFLEFSAGTTAVAGNFFSSDFDLLPQAFEVTIQTNDGTLVSFLSGTGFIGFTDNAGISSLTIDGPDGPNDEFNNWPASSDLWVGAVPAPGAVALLGVSGLFATRRRR